MTGYKAQIRQIENGWIIDDNVRGEHFATSLAEGFEIMRREADGYIDKNEPAIFTVKPIKTKVSKEKPE